MTKHYSNELINKHKRNKNIQTVLWINISNKTTLWNLCFKTKNKNRKKMINLSNQLRRKIPLRLFKQFESTNRPTYQTPENGK